MRPSEFFKEAIREAQDQTQTISMDSGTPRFVEEILSLVNWIDLIRDLRKVAKPQDGLFKSPGLLGIASAMELVIIGMGQLLTFNPLAACCSRALIEEAIGECRELGIPVNSDLLRMTEVTNEHRILTTRHAIQFLRSAYCQNDPWWCPAIQK